MLKLEEWPWEMPHQVNAPATKPDVFSSISSTYIVEGESQLVKVVL